MTVIVITMYEHLKERVRQEVTSARQSLQPRDPRARIKVNEMIDDSEEAHEMVVRVGVGRDRGDMCANFKHPFHNHLTNMVVTPGVSACLWKLSQEELPGRPTSIDDVCDKRCSCVLAPPGMCKPPPLSSIDRRAPS